MIAVAFIKYTISNTKTPIGSEKNQSLRPTRWTHHGSFQAWLPMGNLTISDMTCVKFVD